MSEVVLYDVRDAVAVITLNRPESLNSMTDEFLTRLAELGEKAAADPAVRCVVITGAGRAFCAGGDVKGMAGRNESPREAGSGSASGSGLDHLRDQEEISRLLYEMPKPTIAAVNGHAVGAGLSIALAADIRIASENAKFGLPEASLGIIPAAGGTQRLPRLIGLSRAKDWILTGDIYDANEAYRVGLVSKVVPIGELMNTVREVARKIMARSPLAVRLAKIALNASSHAPLEAGLMIEVLAQGILYESADKYEGMSAFLEKRKAKFTGD